jgi:pantetheine-phosphate adenylyltransferase
MPVVVGNGPVRGEVRQYPLARRESERAMPPDDASGGAAQSRATQPEHKRLVAVYPGSFDPVHRGHIDIAKRAAALVDELIIAVYATPNKKLLFSTDERVGLWRKTIAEEALTNVRVEPFEGLVIDFARSVAAQSIVRGLRAVTDFELEFQQALMNRKLAPEIETVMIVTDLRYLFISATLLKEVARLHGDLDGIVTNTVAAALKERLSIGE